ncbi:MAG: hypothetical protein M1830_001226 [Pleopsidium flavum]|nr:MAG: hypothetical protein M1830_001226 [Pleopsidium flavum]
MTGLYNTASTPLPRQAAQNDNPRVQYYDHSGTVDESQPFSSQRLGHWFDQDGNSSMLGSKGAAKVRRRPPPGSDHVKHRRTRSGCYTCRTRRVKCDETNPICERCKKGNRECVYPEPSTSKATGSSSKGGRNRAPVQESGSSDESDDEDFEGLETIIDDETGSSDVHETYPPGPVARDSGVAPSRKHSHRSSSKAKPPSKTPSILTDKSLSPSTDASSTFSRSYSASASRKLGKLASTSSNTSKESSPSKLDLSHLPRDLQFYLDYHQNHLTHHHYFFKHDAGRFLHTTFLEIAVKSDPLLYAVVGFAAFHHTLRKHNGKIQEFLHYYNKSVSLLRKSLQSGKKNTDATLLTILQLATFEEYLGDWVNLLGHQRAAYEMLVELYSPNTIMVSEVRRKILNWYARFDLFAGLMSGYETVLAREWFYACQQYHRQQLQLHPDNIDYKIERAIADHRLTALDMSTLFAKMSRGAITIEEFMKQNKAISERITAWRHTLDPGLTDPNYAVNSFAGARERDPDDIVDPYRPGGLYQGPLWTVNFLLIDWCAVSLMHRHQTAFILQRQPPDELGALALEQLRLFEAIEFWPGSPSGAVLAVQASLAMASLFLPKDERHIMWCRKKLATIESMGYIYPPTLRTKLSELWNIAGLHHWWLPNDEGYPPIIRSIRSFIEDRTMTPKDQPGEDLRDIKAILQKVSLDDSPRDSPESIGSMDMAYSRISNRVIGISQEGTPIYSTDQDFGGRTVFDATQLHENSATFWDMHGVEDGSDFYTPSRPR